MMWKTDPARRRAVLAAIFVAVVGAGILPAVRILVNPSWADEDDDEGGNAVQAPSRMAVRDGVVTLTLDATAQQNSGIQTESLTAAQVSSSSMSAYGTILDAAPLTALNNQIVEAKAQLQIAQAKLAVTHAAYERAKALYKDRQNISAAQLQGAEGAFQVDQASSAAAQSRLATVMATAQQSWGPVLGQALATQAPLIEELIKRHAYLVKVTLSPTVAVAHAPATARAKVPNGTDVSLRFVSLATSTDPELQGMSYVYKAPAVDGVLPGLNVVASLPTGGATNGVVVPEAAVVWLQGKAWVYLRTSSDTFVRRQIEPDHPGPHGGYVVTGLPSGVRVVVVGAQMLLSEEFRIQTGSGGDQD